MATASAAAASSSDAPDASLIGKNCAYEYCHQLDFLPFSCLSCGGSFCGEHRTEAAHACARAGAWAERQRLAQLARPSVGGGGGREAAASEAPGKCAAQGCDVVIRLPLAPAIHCAKCRRDYCLRHRLLEDHDCVNLVPLGLAAAIGTDAASRTRAALHRLRAWTGASAAALRKSGSAGSGTAAARAAALNKLKSAARGDGRVPADRRVYVHVEAEADGPAPGKEAGAGAPLRANLFFSGDWVVGRVLDAAARELQVDNVNNQADDEAARLRIFHVEGGRLLDFGERFGAAVANGNTIVLLRGVGPPPVAD